jgi:hypothetical protein
MKVYFGSHESHSARRRKGGATTEGIKPIKEKNLSRKQKSGRKIENIFKGGVGT